MTGVRIVPGPDIILRYWDDGSVEIMTVPLGGPHIRLAPFEWAALVARVREAAQ